MSVLSQIGRKDVPTREQVLQQTTGLKAYEFNIEREAAKRQRELESELEKLLINAGVGGEFKQFFIPKKEKNIFKANQ